MPLPTSREGSSVPPYFSTSAPGPSSVDGVLADDPQATLAHHSAPTFHTQNEDIPRGDSASYPNARCGLKRRHHDIYRRSTYYDTRHEERRISTTAVLAGVLGGFGFLCIVACVGWVVWRKKKRRRREARRAARREREMASQHKAERASNTVEGSERTGGPAETDESGTLRKQDRGEVSEVLQPVTHAMGASPRIHIPNHPYAQQQHSARSSVDGRPSSANKPPSNLSHKLSGSTDSLTRRPAAQSTSSPLAALSLLSMETPLPPSPQVLTREKNQSPRPRPPQEEAGRPRTPTLPVHPPIAFGNSSPVGATSRAGRSSPTPRVRPQARRQRVGTADAPAASSDTELFSDASNNAAPRQMPVVTNMGGLGGGGQGVGNVSRTDQSRRVQQTVVLDLPPAYTPD